MGKEIIINRTTPVRIQRWTMEGMMGLATVPLEDVITSLRQNIGGDEDESSYSIKLVDDMWCRIFSMTGNMISIDEIDYKTENDVPIEEMIMAKGSYGTYILKKKFSAESYLRDCGFEEEKIPEVKAKFDKLEALQKADAKIG